MTSACRHAAERIPTVTDPLASVQRSRAGRDIVVNVFLDETRAYYELERLWADAPGIDWEQLVPASQSASA